MVLILVGFVEKFDFRFGWLSGGRFIPIGSREERGQASFEVLAFLLFLIGKFGSDGPHSRGFR